MRAAIYARQKVSESGRPGRGQGGYHINAVDEATQWEVVGAVEQISEAFLILVLEAVLAQFPFRIRGFHSDIGSEFMSHMLVTYGHLFPNSRETAAKKLQQAMFTGRKERTGSSLVAKPRKRVKKAESRGDED